VEWEFYCRYEDLSAACLLQKRPRTTTVCTATRSMTAMFFVAFAVARFLVQFFARFAACFCRAFQRPQRRLVFS